jgi:hypothetical protein
MTGLSLMAMTGVRVAMADSRKGVGTKKSGIGWLCCRQVSVVVWAVFGCHHRSEAGCVGVEGEC